MFGKKREAKDDCKCTTKDLNNANTSNSQKAKSSDMTSGSRSTKSCSGKASSSTKSCSAKSSSKTTKSCN